jgi:hypothetical protein
LAAAVAPYGISFKEAKPLNVTSLGFDGIRYRGGGACFLSPCVDLLAAVDLWTKEKGSVKVETGADFVNFLEPHHITAHAILRLFRQASAQAVHR